MHCAPVLPCTSMVTKTYRSILIKSALKSERNCQKINEVDLRELGPKKGKKGENKSGFSGFPQRQINKLLFQESKSKKLDNTSSPVDNPRFFISN